MGFKGNKYSVIKGFYTVRLIFAFILLFLISIGFITYKIFSEINNSEYEREDAYKQLSGLSVIHKTLDNCQKDFEYYLMSSGKDNCDKLNKYRDTVYSLLQKQRLISRKHNNTEVKILEKYIYNQFSFMERIIFAKEKKDNKSFVYSIINAQNYGLKISSMLDKYEQSRVKYLNDIVQKKQDKTIKALAMGTFTTVLFFLVIFFILEKEIINRKKTESRADREVMLREKLINNSIDGIVSFDTNCNITLWNPGIASLTGISKSTAIGRNAFHVLPVLKDIGEEENFNETLKGNYLISKGKKLQFNSRNKILYYDAYYSPVFDAVKKVIGGLIIIRDNTQRKLISDALAKTKEEFEVKVLERTAALSYLNEELKKELSYRKISEQKINQSLHEKVIMLQEIHHRMKNNLQVISSLLNLQSNYIMNEDTLEVFRESQNRVKSMALIHEKLYKSGDVQTVEFNEYITSLCNDLFLSYNVNSSRVKLITDLSNVSLEINTAILCGLIVNELISNSLKHAFPGNRSGCIYISLNSSDNECTLVIKDDGDGFPPGIDFRNTESLGLQIVNILTEQLGGRIELNTGVYTEFKIMFHAAKTTVAAACV